MVEFLFEHGADSEIYDSTGRTALHVAISHGNIDYIEILLRSGHSLLTTNLDGQTPYKFAKECGSSRKIRKLLKP